MTPSKSESEKDHWSAAAYKNAASFVPKLTTTVIKYLDAQPDDHILDIGCGDGILTAQIAASLTGGGKILGLDASRSFIETAKSENQSKNASYELQDCTRLGQNAAINGSWDKVFSNAALHWILRNEGTRQSTLQQIHSALKPGGKFVFEMGGKGNVGEIHVAFTSALMAHGVSIAEARKANPWFFPSVEWMKGALTQAGFHVEICELEYRPTRTVDPSTNAGGTGLAGWLKLMGAQFLEAVAPEKRDSVVEYVCSVVQDVLTREEDGSQWLGNVRLRAVATKAV